MSSAREGWYQDPTAPDRLRWWDGATWTGHTTGHPAATSTVAGDERTDGGAARTGLHGDERTFGQNDGAGGATQDPPSGGAVERRDAELTPVWSTTATGAPAVPPPSPGDSAGPATRRRGSVAALAGIAVIVIVVVAGLVGTVSSERQEVGVSDGLDVTVDEPGFDEAGGQVVPPDQRLEAGRTLRLGGTATGRVGDGEAWMAQIEMTQTFEVRVDVRGTDGFDAVATLRDADGQIVARNDDRGDDGVSRVGGDQLDPLLEATLEPGVYELEVVGFATLAGSFAVRVDPSGAS